jgi:hypothetical protein
MKLTKEASCFQMLVANSVLWNFDGRGIKSKDTKLIFWENDPEEKSHQKIQTDQDDGSVSRYGESSTFDLGEEGESSSVIQSDSEDDEGEVSIKNISGFLSVSKIFGETSANTNTPGMIVNQSY